MATIELLPDRSPLAESLTRGDAGLPGDVAGALARRGIALAPAAGDDPERHERRVETALMALFRDTRGETAFEALYRRARKSLFSWIVHLLASRGQDADPAEILQDTFVNVYRYAGGFREGDGHSFRGWARTIAANVVRRSRARRPGVSLQAMPQGLAEPEDQRDGPEETASVDEQRERLRRAWTLLLLHYVAAFDKLSERDRDALTLVEVDGLSYAEAGRRLSVGRSNMKMIMFRSRKRIRAHVMRQMLMEEAREVRAVG